MTILSDGAGCFQGNYLFLILPHLVKMTKIKVIQHIISETGRGKTALDSHFGRANQFLQTNVREGAGHADVPDAESA
eukprot:gene35128-43309_t